MSASRRDVDPAEIIDTIVETALDWVLGLRGWTVVGGVFLMAFAETALFVGLVIPGETAMAIAGVIAARQDLPLAGLIAVGALGAVIGDNVSYWVARRAGRGIVHRYDWLEQRVGPRLDRANRFFDRHGARAVLVGRWIGWLRALLPFVAGLGKMVYPRFLLWVVVAGVTWAATIVTLGYVLGDLFVDALRSHSTAITLGFLALVVGVWAVRHLARRDGGRSGHRGDRW